MDRRTLQVALVVAFGVPAIALAAATLTSTVTPETGFGGGADGPGDGGGGVDPAPSSAPTNRPVDAVSNLFLERLLLPAALLTVLVAAGYALYRREALPFLLGVLAVLGAVWLLLQFLPWTVTTGAPPAAGATGASPFGGGNGSGAGGTGAIPWTPVAALLLLGIGLVGAFLVHSGSAGTRSGRRGRPDDDGGADDGATDASAIGRVAGRTADRIERGGGVENDVFRAWREMTARLDVSDPDTTTPGEFATAAVGAGMAPDDVRELTRLFEDVRYGGYPPTDRRERRAVRVFRRIEAEYVPDDT